MFFGSVEIVVAPDHDIESSFLNGGGHDDFFDTLVKVRLKKGRGPEFPRTFEDDIDSHFNPVDRPRGAL